MTTKIRKRSEEIRNFILEHNAAPGIAGKVMAKFGITRQAANRHLKTLTADGSLISQGETRKRSYKLAPAASETFLYEIVPGLAEDEVWRNDIKPFLGELTENVLQIWNYAFTEMFNNAIDHSEGKEIAVIVTKSGVNTEIYIADDGIGIFTKIQAALNLPDEKQAIFELSKGKLTTDAANHSGQGIFFTSRLVNNFTILSGEVEFRHELKSDHDWLHDRETSREGTSVFMRVENHTAYSVEKVYAKYSVKNSYGFNKTIVPVKLAKYGTDQLVSRSQAKRVLVRVDQFSQVIFDFSGVDIIGQAFADQIFRVFAAEHPEVELIPSHASEQIMGLIQSVIKAGRPGYKGSPQETSQLG